MLLFYVIICYLILVYWLGRVWSDLRFSQPCLKLLKAQLLLYVPLVLTFINYTFCPQSMFVCFYISQNKERLFIYATLIDGFYYRDGLCLLCGTNWIFKYSSDSFVSPVVVPWPRRLVDSFSPRRVKFDPLLVRVRFVVDRMALDKFLCEYLGFPC